jgi:hypothetical protein
MKNITLYTLGELLTHPNPTIRRLAGSILKLLQRQDPSNRPPHYTKTYYDRRPENGKVYIVKTKIK